MSLLRHSPWPGDCRSATPTLARGEFNMWKPVLTLDGAVCAILGFGGIGKATGRLMRGRGLRVA
jgi:lactate dehydrogenase-like 2-hydroxyacid dehydrogenase